MAQFIAHTHPETTSDSDPIGDWDVHTTEEQCAARMCTFGQCWGPEDDARQIERAQAYLAVYGRDTTEAVADARAEQARAQWSGDDTDKWF